jgi:vitamin B12 transporter
VKTGILVGGAVSLALTGAAVAQEDRREVQLEGILVTDGLTPVEQEKSGRAFTVITGEQLERNQVRYVADALRQVPGFAVSKTGGFGGPVDVRVRGAEANHLLVLVDGVEIGDFSTGSFDFASLLVADIDRIEVLRGPQSTFWGSNATAGVVNVITRRGERNGWRVNTLSEVDTDRTVLGGVSVSGGGEAWDVALSGAFRRTDGFNISDFGSEKDGDRNTTLNGKVTVDLSENLTLDGTLRFVDRKSDVDPQDFSSDPVTWAPGPFYGLVIDGDDWTSTREFLGSVGLTHVALDGALTQKARFTGSDLRRENFDSFGLSWTEGNRLNGTYQASYAFDTPSLLDARHTITGGYEWERETFAPSHLTETFERQSNSLVGEYRGEFLDQFYLNGGLRQDFNDRFGDATTYSVSGAWKVPGTEARLHASVGTGVTNPTFFEQFGFTPATFRGNPDLVPEESLGWDIGIEYGFFDRQLVVDVTYFKQNLTNEIATVFGGPPTFLSSPINRDGESRRQGVEVAATLNLFNGLTANATYTYTDATEQTLAGGPRLREVRRPMHSGSVGLAYTFMEDRARVFGEAVFNGRMDDNAFVPSLPPRVTLDSYTVVNIGGSYRLNDNLEVHGRIENLFDEDYEEVFGYNAQGRTAFLGLKGTF